MTTESAPDGRPRVVSRGPDGAYGAPVDLSGMIAQERRRAADLIEPLTPDQLRTPSLCSEWTVHDVAGHLLMPLVTPLIRFVAAMVTSGFDFDRANVRLTAKVSSLPAPEIAAALRQRAGHPFRPPGSGYEAPLTDLVVHQQDMRRPLGLGTDVDPDHLRTCLDYVASGKAKAVASARRVSGLRLQATDLDWSAGDGALVRGPGEALLLAMAGRSVALDDLDGEGVAVLRQRPTG